VAAGYLQSGLATLLQTVPAAWAHGELPRVDRGSSCGLKQGPSTSGKGNRTKFGLESGETGMQKDGGKTVRR